MKILITAGPTREHLDDVRFLSSASSGKVGYALAHFFLSRGEDVFLISGPTYLEPPSGCKFVKVEAGCQMHKEVLSKLNWCDVLIMAAAVGDYRPAKRIKGKEKKKKGPVTLKFKDELVRLPEAFVPKVTEKILSEIPELPENKMEEFKLALEEAYPEDMRKLNSIVALIGIEGGE
jgi:phosphopantothenoylcysteine decarboxylase/phosphopantothenate--cysteine ligase